MSFQEYADETTPRRRLGSISPKVLGGALAILLAIAALIVVNLVGLPSSSQALTITSAAEVSESESPDVSDASEEAPQTICVHVGGCVATPGIYYLAEGSRVADAVAAAGGMTGEAAQDTTNLARVLADGEQVLIASASDLAAESSQSTSSETSSSQSTQSSKVNINTASSSELQTVSGIGEAKAAKIIAYREKNGPFKTVDDLVNVSGIGEKTLEAIRDALCV